jgi:superfamily II DNA or RNA helicase
MIRNPYKKSEPKKRERPVDAAVLGDDDDDDGMDWDAAVRLVDDELRRRDSALNPNMSADTDELAKSNLPPRSEMQRIKQDSIASLRPVARKQAILMMSSFVSNCKTTTTRAAVNVPRQESHPAVLQYPLMLSSPVSNCNTATTTRAEVNDPRQESLPAVLQYPLEAVAAVQDEHRKLLVQHAQLSLPLLNGWTLFSHQKRAILRGLIMRRMILALDMGLGKTLIGCVWARAFRNTFVGGVCTTRYCKIIVICPVSLQQEWKRTAESATGLKVSTKHADANSSDNDGGNDDDDDVWIVSWSKVPTKVGFSQYVVVADEAHSMQNMKAARTVQTLQLTRPSHCLGVLLLTGTPMKNGRPSNLLPLLKAVRHPLARHERAFETHFCQGRHIYFGQGGGGTAKWTATGSAHLSQLRELTQSHLLHLTKDECLKELPPQTRVFQAVPVSSRMQMQHDEALRHLAKVFTDKKNSINANGDAILGAVQKLRMIGSLAKIDGTVQLAKQVLETEPAIVIFTSFQKVAAAVHRQLCDAGWQGELLTGETPAKKRELLVDKFQNGLSPVFCCTFGAGGVGLTLTAAHTCVLLDRPWTPGEAHQAEDRVRRIGQTKPVRCIWMSAFNLDHQIDDMLQQKSLTASTVLARKTASPDDNATGCGKHDDDDSNNCPKLSVFQMLQKVMPPYSGGAVSGLKQTSMLEFSQEVT